MFVSFLGIGQGGSNIADVGARNGFYSCAINYSSKDLESLQHIKEKLCLIGSEGVGKDRQQAIKLMNSNWDLSTKFVKEHFSHPSIEIIFVPFSTAGGSGSGVAPVLLSMLCDLMPEKTFVAMPIIPDTTEAYQSQVNCLEAFEDLSKLNIAILPIDNEQVRTTMYGVGRVGLYRNTNEKVIQIIKDVISYTDKSSQYSVLDKKDLLSIFKTKGFATISEFSFGSLGEDFEITQLALSERIQKSWNKSPFAHIELDQVISAGIVFDGDEMLSDALNTRKIFSPFDNKMPLNLYEGIYNESASAKVISILSGLHLCKSRLNIIENIVDSNKNGVKLTNQSHQYISNVTPIRQEIHVKKQPSVKDISDMISKFRR